MFRTPIMLSALCALAAAPTLEAQLAHVIPNGCATAEASGSSSYPWNRTTGEIRVMYVYDSTHFTDAGINYPILIDSLKGRANGSATATWSGGTYTGMTIDMGTAVFDWMTASVTFDANYGGDRTQVFNGNATVKPSPIIGGSSPQPEFYAEANFTSLFLYDPSSGNDLVVDFVIPTGSWGGGTSYSVDLAFGTAAVPPAVGCRFWNLTAASPTAANASPQLHSSHVVEIGYKPAKGLYPNFKADTTVGPEGMTVNFKDTSYTSDPGGILVQTWTFGDGNTGSGAAPSNTYTCGTFDVGLTVVDATGSKSITKTGYISAGLVTADFTASSTTGFAPLSVTFTNTSVGTNATSRYLWNFGDGGTSSAENPTHIYTVNGTYDVSLTCGSRCSKDKKTVTGLIEVGVGKLETTFAGGNGLSAVGSGNLFDVKIKNPQGLKIASLDMSFWVVGAFDIEIWCTPGTYIGNDNLPAKWVQVSAGTGTAATSGYGSRTHVNTDDFYLPPGDYGMYIISSNGVAYSNGNGTNQNYGNADLELALGTGKNTKFTGSMFNPRIWNGAIFYQQDNTAANGPIGYGCPGSSASAPTMSLSAEPVLGTSVTIDVANMTATTGPGWLFIGMADPVGFDLTPLGMTDCLLSANPILVTQPILNSAGSASLPVPIPNTPAFAGVYIGLQAANVDTGANALNVAATAGHAVRIGN
jgi:PKD repeat protein